MATQPFPVVSGPSRESFFDSCRLVEEDRKVPFTWIRPDEVRQTARVVITSVSSIYGHPDWWVLRGNDMTMQGDNAVTLVYSSKSRTGVIQFGALTSDEVEQTIETLFSEMLAWKPI